jgi:GR25 family glycosyltransferase involved in LPS biosynthesis
MLRHAALVLLIATPCAGQPWIDAANYAMGAAGSAMYNAWSQVATHTCVQDDQWFTSEAKQPVPQSEKPPYVEAWYVNAKGQTDRAKCIDRQLKESGFQPHRFNAAVHPRLKQGNYHKQMAESDFKDCIPSGVDWEATASHGSNANEKMTVRQGVVSNWCSHYRIFKELQNRSSEYFLIFEDDAIINREEIMPLVEDFVENYKGYDWNMVQIDPFGGKDRATVIGYHRGRPVFRPCLKQGKKGEQCKDNFANRWMCAQYYGFHAILVKKSKIGEVLNYMSTNPAVPIDWMPLRLEGSISWLAGVAGNPEATTAPGGKAVHVPTYCSKSILKSTIGFGNEETSNKIQLRQKKKQALLQKK